MRAAGLVVLGFVCLWAWREGPSLAGVASLAGLALLVADRFVWRHTRTSDLRRRYRALGARVEALDARLQALGESESIHRSLTETFGDLAVQVAPGRNGRHTIAFANTGFRALFPAAGTLPVAFDGDDATGESEVETADGPKVLAWRALPALDARGRPAIRWIARDVTDAARAATTARSAARQAERKAETKGRFLAMAAHEIRNPLTGIAGMAELLSMSGLNPHAASQVEAISQATTALQSVLEDLLDDARMEADRLVVEHEPFDLGAVLEGVCELAAPRAHHRELDLACHTVRHGDEAVPGTVLGDADRVRQIVTNLVGNALKFTETGGITVLARTVTDGGATGLRIEVRDTGPGLTEEEAARIFDVFESGGDEEAAQRLARRLGGVGLGLSISRRLAQAMGGTLGVASRPDEGCVFTLALPGGAATSPQARSLQGSSVLLVAESATLAAPLRRFVEERGGRLVVMNGASWTERLRVGRPWEDGPVLVDEQQIDGEALADSSRDVVLLVRDAARNEPAPRWLRLPWRAASLERALGGAAHVDAHEPSVLRAAIDTGGAGGRVLVVEDDPVTQLLATAVLERAGHRVTLAATGHEAARLYREAAEGIAADGEGVDMAEPFTAALIDINLTVTGETGMDGMSALRGIRAIEAARNLEPTPIHVVTGDGSPATAEVAKAAGATSVLVKPVPVPILAALISPSRQAA